MCGLRLSLRRLFLTFSIATTFAAGLSADDITVSRLFSDHMVLQRNARVAVWGTANPDEEIEVVFGEQTSRVKAGTDGKWMAWISTGPAGGPYELTVKGEGAEPRIAFSDILLGDVWLCSGQSNMEWPVSAAAFAEKEVSSSSAFDQIRLCTVNQNAAVTPLDEPARLDGWHVCSPKSVPGFSATAYFFARNLYESQGVPVGVVCSAWGGTACEAWTCIPALQANEKLRSIVEGVNLEQPLAAPNYPGSLFNGMISPIRHLQFSGILWYQGEANVGRAEQYRELLPTMIANWRGTLQNGSDLPFYIVQLAPFRYSGAAPEALPEIWEAQLQTFRDVKNCGIAITTDIGDFADIHPSNKQEVGRRLALWAIHEALKTGASGTRAPEKVPADSRETKQKGASPDKVPTGPLYRGHRIEGSRLIVDFDYVGSGLKAPADGKLTEFQICGANGEFVAAEAVIEGETVVVTSAAVSEPIAVRFSWRDTPEPNLFNAEGLPASPFRTDIPASKPENGGR